MGEVSVCLGGWWSMRVGVWWVSKTSEINIRYVAEGRADERVDE